MRTKDELFREALRHIAARRQQAVTAAERDRAAALAASDEAAVSPFLVRPLSRPGSLPPSAALPAAEQPVRASAAAASPEI